MSELNRLLSDLSSLENKDNSVTLDRIPSAWGFRFARVALALFGTLAGASGLAWAISSADLAGLSRDFAAESLKIFDSRAPQVESRTVKPDVYIRALSPESINATQAILLAKLETKPSNTPPVKSSVEVSGQQMLSVESVSLTGEQLATIAYDKAQKRALEGDTKKAIDYLYDAVQYNPLNVAAVNQLAGLLFGRNKIREAENVLRKGIQINPTSATLRLTLARIYQQTQREESALIVLIAAEDSLDDDDPMNLVSMRAALAQKFGKHELAKDSYQWLTEKDPMDGRWWLGLGVAAERENTNKEAISAYQEAVNAGGLSDQAVKFARERIAYLQGLSQEVPVDGK